MAKSDTWFWLNLWTLLLSPGDLPLFKKEAFSLNRGRKGDVRQGALLCFLCPPSSHPLFYEASGHQETWRRGPVIAPPWAKHIV